MAHRGEGPAAALTGAQAEIAWAEEGRPSKRCFMSPASSEAPRKTPVPRNLAMVLAGWLALVYRIRSGGANSFRILDRPCARSGPDRSASAPLRAQRCGGPGLSRIARRRGLP